MSSSSKRAAGALCLLVFTLPGISNAADNGSAPPTTTAPPPATTEIQLAPIDDAHHNSNDDIAATTAPTSGPKSFTFFGKNKLACFDAPGAGPGAVIYENFGPGDLTVGMKIKVVIQPTGKIITYVLPYDVPAKTGVILYDAYPPGSTTAVPTCTVTATHVVRHMSKP